MAKEHTATITFSGTETGSINSFEAVPENCFILGWGFHIENVSNIGAFASVALRYADDSLTTPPPLITPSQYSLDPTVALTRYKIASANLLYGQTSILGKMNYYYSTERRVFITFNSSPSAGSRLVIRTQYAALSDFSTAEIPVGIKVTNFNTQPTAS